MRLRGRQGRFVAASIGGWIAARIWLLWPAAPVAVLGSMVALDVPGRHLPPCECAPATAFGPGKARAPSPPRPRAMALPASPRA